MPSKEEIKRQRELAENNRAEEGYTGRPNSFKLVIPPGASLNDVISSEWTNGQSKQFPQPQGHRMPMNTAIPEPGYRVPGVPYPRVPAPRSEDENFDLLGNPMPQPSEADRIRATANRSGLPVSAFTQPQSSAPAASGPTVIQPSRTAAFSRADAQALAALDPRALEDANRIAAMPESRPSKMTATFGGQNFEMQPNARVDRNVLARLYAQAAERKAQERQDDVRGQEQTGKERLVTIPGQQMTDREKMRLESDAALLKEKQEFERPERDARVGSTQAQTEASVAEAGRKATEFDESRRPEVRTRKSADETIKALIESGAAQTPQGRATIAALFKLGGLGSALPPDVGQQVSDTMTSPSPGQSVEAVQEAMADKTLQDLATKVKDAAQGAVLASPQGKRIQNQHIRNLNQYVRKLATAKGVDPQEIFDMLSPDLEKSMTRKSLGESLSQSNPVTRGIDRFLGNETVPETVPFGR